MNSTLQTDLFDVGANYTAQLGMELDAEMSSASPSTPPTPGNSLNTPHPTPPQQEVASQPPPRTKGGRVDKKRKGEAKKEAKKKAKANGEGSNTDLKPTKPKISDSNTDLKLAEPKISDAATDEDARSKLDRIRRATLIGQVPFVRGISQRLETLYATMGLTEGMIVTTSDHQHHTWIHSMPVHCRGRRLLLAIKEIENRRIAANLDRMLRDISKARRSCHGAASADEHFNKKSFVLEVAAASLAKIKSVGRAAVEAQVKIAEKAHLECMTEDDDLAKHLEWTGCRILVLKDYEQVDNRWTINVDDLRKKNHDISERERKERRAMCPPQPAVQTEERYPGARNRNTPRSYRHEVSNREVVEVPQPRRGDYDVRPEPPRRRRRTTPPRAAQPALFTSAEIETFKRQQSEQQSFIARAEANLHRPPPRTTSRTPPMPPATRRRSRSPPPAAPPRREASGIHEREAR
jgi:hypothetical protein